MIVGKLFRKEAVEKSRSLSVVSCLCPSLRPSLFTWVSRVKMSKQGLPVGKEGLNMSKTMVSLHTWAKIAHTRNVHTGTMHRFRII